MRHRRFCCHTVPQEANVEPGRTAATMAETTIQAQSRHLLLLDGEGLCWVLLLPFFGSSARCKKCRRNPETSEALLEKPDM